MRHGGSREGAASPRRTGGSSRLRPHAVLDFTKVHQRRPHARVPRGWLCLDAASTSRRRMRRREAAGVGGGAETGCDTTWLECAALRSPHGCVLACCALQHSTTFPLRLCAYVAAFHAALVVCASPGGPAPRNQTITRQPSCPLAQVDAGTLYYACLAATPGIPRPLSLCRACVRRRGSTGVYRLRLTSRTPRLAPRTFPEMDGHLSVVYFLRYAVEAINCE